MIPVYNGKSVFYAPVFCGSNSKNVSKMTKQRNSVCTFTALALFSVCSAVPTLAETPTVKTTADILPAKTLEGVRPDLEKHVKTDPPLQLSPERSELLRLDQDAASIIVGNSNHLNVVADSPRTIVIIPRMPGVSNFTVLDHTGNVIMQKDVIVAGPKQSYVRIRNTCKSDDASCKTTDVYYCPDICHEVGLVRDSKEPSSVTSYEFSESYTDSAPENDDGTEQANDSEAIKKQIKQLEEELQKTGNQEDTEETDEEVTEE